MNRSCQCQPGRNVLARLMDAAMKAGTNLNIGMESVTRKPVTIPVSLAGFTVAIDKLEAIR